MSVCDRPTDPRRYWHCFTYEQWDVFSYDEWFGFLYYPFDEWRVEETALASVCVYRSGYYPRASVADTYAGGEASQVADAGDAGVWAGEGPAGAYVERGEE